MLHLVPAKFVQEADCHWQSSQKRPWRCGSVPSLLRTTWKGTWNCGEWALEMAAHAKNNISGKYCAFRLKSRDDPSPRKQAAYLQPLQLQLSPCMS